jgi:CRP-like cAMP-binding protein
MSAQKKDPAHEELLSVLRTAKNRLEYVSQNDWMLIVDRAKRTTFKKDDVLIHAGKQHKTVYLLVKGNAKVEGATKAFIAQIGPGEICGEMAFLENGVASASVMAAGELEVCAIEWSALLDLFELYPHLGSRFYRSLAVNLSRRLREVIGARQSSKPSS